MDGRSDAFGLIVVVPSLVSNVGDESTVIGNVSSVTDESSPPTIV
jgi:hypothetical protein